MDVHQEKIVTICAYVVERETKDVNFESTLKILQLQRQVTALMRTEPEANIQAL